MADQYLNAINQQGYYTPPTEEEQRNRIQRDKLMMMGASMLANSGKRVNPLAAIGQGLMVGMGAGQETEQLLQQEMTRGYANEAMMRKVNAERALASALPALVGSGWSDDAVKAQIASNPAAGASILEMYNKRLKDKAELDKTAAETRDKKTTTDQKIAEKFANRANYLSKWTGLTPEATMKFAQEVEAAGVGHVLPKVPFQTWASPDEARKNLSEMASMFYDIKDQTSQAETGRHNLTTEQQQAATLAQTIARDKETNDVALKNYNVAAGRLNLERENANAWTPTMVGDQLYQTNRKGDVRPALAGDKPITAPTKVSESTLAKMAQNEASLASIQRGRQLVRDNPDAFGVKNYLPDQAMQRIDPAGVDARAEVGKVGATKIHDLSGAAVTVSEFPRLAVFIPNVRDTPAAIDIKLANLEREMLQVQTELSAGKSLATMIRERTKNEAVSPLTTPGEPTAPKSTMKPKRVKFNDM